MITAIATGLAVWCVGGVLVQQVVEPVPPRGPQSRRGQVTAAGLYVSLLPLLAVLFAAVSIQYGVVEVERDG